MPEKRQSRVSPKRSEAQRGDKTQEARTSKAPQARGNRLRDELDDLLEEIDQVLETNAEEFVNSYVQKGGQ